MAHESNRLDFLLRLFWQKKTKTKNEISVFPFIVWAIITYIQVWSIKVSGLRFHVSGTTSIWDIYTYIHQVYDILLSL